MSILWESDLADRTEAAAQRPDRLPASILGATFLVTSIFGMGTCAPITSPGQSVGPISDWTRHAPRAARTGAPVGVITGTGATGLLLVEPVATRLNLGTDAQIRLMHERSGLTWEQLARLFGVSRRAVHNWAAGSRLSGGNAETLARVVAALSERAHYSAEENRNWLLTTRDDRTSLFDEIRHARKRGTPIEEILPIRERLGI